MAHIFPMQCRAARVLVGWSQADLAAAANVNKRTVMDFENGIRQPHPGTLALLVTALDQAGAEVIQKGPYTGDGGPGVRLKGTE